MLKFLPVFLFLVGCLGTNKIINNYSTYPAYYSQYDSDFRNIVMDFEVDAAMQNSPADIKNIKLIKMVEGEIVGNDPNNPLPINVIAICQRQNNNTNNYIHVEISWWYDASDYQRKQVLYHELGHCSTLSLGHNDTKFKWSCGIGYSIMKSSAVPGIIMEKCWPSMVQELFDPQYKAITDNNDCKNDVCSVKKQEELSPGELLWWAVVTYGYGIFIIVTLMWILAMLFEKGDR